MIHIVVKESGFQWFVCSPNRCRACCPPLYPPTYTRTGGIGARGRTRKPGARPAVAGTAPVWHLDDCRRSTEGGASFRSSDIRRGRLKFRGASHKGTSPGPKEVHCSRLPARSRRGPHVPPGGSFCGPVRGRWFRPARSARFTRPRRVSVGHVAKPGNERLRQCALRFLAVDQIANHFGNHQRALEA